MPFMKDKSIKKIFLILLVTVFLGCDKNITGNYTYKVLNNITYTVNTKKLSYHADIKSVFLHFDLNIVNKNDDDVYLDIGKIQAKLNNETSVGTYYDSLASVMTKKEKLKKNHSIYKLYFVFSENLKEQDLNEFTITNFGISG